MSVQSQINRIKTAVELAYTKLKSKGAILPTSQTVENLADCADTIFPAFYTLTKGSGTATQTFYQIPFTPDIVSMQMQYGIGNLEDYIGTDKKKSAVFTVEIIPGFARARKAIHGTLTPQEVTSNVTVTSVADGNGTYTVSVYAGGSTFYNKQPFICFLAKKQG